VKTLDKNNAVFAVIPPVTALLQSKILEQRIAAFPEEGMEALHILKIDGFPAIIAAAHGRTIYS
jgi:fumarate hydratase subunit beta